MHMLDFNKDGIARFAFQRKHVDKVWHHEGIEVPDGATTIGDWLIAANMEWVLKSAPLVATLNDSLIRLGDLDLDKMTLKTAKAAISATINGISFVGSHKLIYRDNLNNADDFRHLSVMGKDYAFLQPVEAFQIIEDVVKEGLLEVQTIGTMHDGKRIFFACKIVGGDVEVIPGDMLEKYLMCLDSYDGTTALTYASVATLPVCNNTVNAALREVRGKQGRKAYARHTSGLTSKERIDNLRVQIGLASENLDTHAAWLRELAQVKMGENDQRLFFEKLIHGDSAPVLLEDWSKQQQRAVGELEYLASAGNGADLDGRKGTANGAFNAVTEWTNHVKNHRGSNFKDRTAFVLTGSGHKINSRAAALLSSQYNIELAA